MKSSNIFLNGTVFALIASAGIASSAVVSNPGSLGSDLGGAISIPGDVSEEVGNTSLATWNLLDINGAFARLNFTFETEDGYGPIASGANTINTSVRNVDIVRDSGNFGPIVTTGNQFRSGGDESIVWGSMGAGGTFTFNDTVDGVAFFANRLNANLTVILYADAAKTQVIATPFTLNNTNGRSFFGYTDPNASIRAVSFVSDGGQFGIDDFSFAVAVPEPGTLSMILVATLLLYRFRKKSFQNEIVQ